MTTERCCIVALENRHLYAVFKHFTQQLCGKKTNCSGWHCIEQFGLVTSRQSPQVSNYCLKTNYIKLPNYIGQHIIKLDRISGLKHRNLCHATFSNSSLQFWFNFGRCDSTSALLLHDVRKSNLDQTLINLKTDKMLYIKCSCVINFDTYTKTPRQLSFDEAPMSIRSTYLFLTTSNLFKGTFLQPDLSQLLALVLNRNWGRKSI